MGLVNLEKVLCSLCKIVFLFLFRNIAINRLESLKMHSKLYKNRKISNKDFLKSLKLDLCIGVKICWVLTESFCCFYLSMENRDKFITKVALLQML